VSEWFMVHEGLADAARVPPLARSRDRMSVLELLVLLASGAAASTAIGMAKLQLGIPGHSIVLAALPVALGLSLAPRHLAGSIMSTGALGTAWLLQRAGVGDYGSGSFVSLCLLGPLLDLALRGARRGWRVYAALVLAGTATNLLALGSRASFKLLGLDTGGGRPFDIWWLQALATYTASGLVAGLVGAVCWFNFRTKDRGPSTDQAPA
jgi:hypothetical protein